MTGYISYSHATQNHAVIVQDEDGQYMCIGWWPALSDAQDALDKHEVNEE